MIRCFALVLLLAGGIAAEAQAQRIEGAEVVGYGLFEATNKQEVIDPSISSGKRINYEEARIVTSTSTIPVAGEKVVVFGAAIRLRGSPQGQSTTVSVVWLYPGQGLTNPSTGNTKTKDEFQTQHKFGENSELLLDHKRGLDAGSRNMDPANLAARSTPGPAVFRLGELIGHAGATDADNLSLVRALPARTRTECDDASIAAYAVSANSSRPISQRRISLVPAPIS